MDAPARFFLQREKPRAVEQGNVEDWATESLQAAKRAYILPGTRSEPISTGAALGREYYLSHLETVSERLAQAGIRLAWVLNETLGEAQ